MDDCAAAVTGHFVEDQRGDFACHRRETSVPGVFARLECGTDPPAAVWLVGDVGTWAVPLLVGASMKASTPKVSQRFGSSAVKHPKRGRSRFLPHVQQAEWTTPDDHSISSTSRRRWPA
jgi:hypothetical protein